ncbi:transcriptional regulator, HxlR family [Glycomyces sambucus]|uniref:Transcriptional regulator, HxlR family n=1 Tax=Glycomyces sambucus TaxID=380244 RepID=A0A1G9CDA0_9ACTN|nr:helix-turn-helix domain-containing protein [Glycomyces sambucus]SDK49632.1 transcriptional regulator, HxlR family [Glycomyces sambucus]
MTLPSTYRDRNCSIARALEVVGERWTLLIVRDAFYGVRRYGDFAVQLGVPRAVLTDRLKTLVAEGVMERGKDEQGALEYRLTGKGRELWPVLRALMGWGDAFYSPQGPRRSFRHAADGGLVDAGGRCAACGRDVPAPDLLVEPGPGFDAGAPAEDPVSALIDTPRPLLEPIS